MGANDMWSTALVALISCVIVYLFIEVAAFMLDREDEE